TWAASCRISSSASGSVRVMIWTLASVSIGSARSASFPSSEMATAFLASDLEMPAASSEPVRPFLKDRLLPSGKVSATSLMAISSHSLQTKQVRWALGAIWRPAAPCAWATAGVSSGRRYVDSAHHFVRYPRFASYGLYERSVRG